MNSVGWRSTTLQIANKHCPKALDFYEAGTPYHREVFAVGVVAHAILEELGRETERRNRWLSPEESEDVAATLCLDIIANGRDFEGEREPPLPADLVFQGRDLALAFQREKPLPPGRRYEEGLAVTRDWTPCPYGPGAWLRARIDSIGTAMPDWTNEEEDGMGAMLEVTDYKSAFTADESELLTLQRKIQAVLAWDRYGDGHDGLRLVVVNFRLQKSYDLLVIPGTPEGAGVIARWRSDIEAAIRAREVQKGPEGRPAIPGMGCNGCPWIHACQAAQHQLRTIQGGVDPVELAVTYTVASSVMASLKPLLQAASAEAPIVIPGGGLVGTVIKEQRALKPSAPEILADIWHQHAKPDTLDLAKAQLPGLLTALSLGVSNAEELLKLWYKGRGKVEARMKLMGSLVQKAFVRQFGIHKAEASHEDKE